jgi:glycosyltransferase involved in cell wall biosynthesis
MFRTEENPLISIIMPVYNREQLILATIQSIISQTYAHWELIIIDDGSTDGTEQAINRFQDERIQFHKAGRTGIIGKLKNIGLEHASGALIGFMDSDDLWREDKLEKQVVAFGKYPDAGYSLTGGYTFYELGKPVQYYYKERSGELYGDLLEAFFLARIAALIPTLVFRRECLASVPSFDESRKFSDNAFLLQLAALFKGVVLYEPFLYRRLHESNMTSDQWELGYTEYEKLIIEYRDKALLKEGIAREALFRVYLNYGEKCLRYGQRSKARRIFLKAWGLRPFSIVGLRKVIKALGFTT